MADASKGKPVVDFSETDAVVVDEDGRPRVRMESLKKRGTGGIKALFQRSTDE